MEKQELDLLCGNEEEFAIDNKIVDQIASWNAASSISYFDYRHYLLVIRMASAIKANVPMTGLLYHPNIKNLDSKGCGIIHANGQIQIDKTYFVAELESISDVQVLSQLTPVEVIQEVKKLSRTYYSTKATSKSKWIKPQLRHVNLLNSLVKFKSYTLPLI